MLIKGRNAHRQGKVAGRKPPIPEGWVYDSPWDDVLIQGDGEASTLPLIPGAVKGVNDFSNYLMDQGSWTNPLTWPGVLAGALGEGISDVPNKLLQGEDVTTGDATLFGMEFIPGIGLAAKGAKRIPGHAALPQDITRRNHAYEDADAVKGWYKGGKGNHLAGMVGTAVKQPLRRLWDTEADALYRKHGISDSQKKEFERAFDYMDSGGKRQMANNNEIISNAQYIESIAQKYFPGKPGFSEDMKKLLFPRTVQTTGSSMAESALPIRRVLGDFGDASNEDILAHISRPIVGKHNLGDKQVILNSKVWNDRTPLGTMLNKANDKRGRVNSLDRKFHGTAGNWNPAATVTQIMKGLPDGPVTFNDILAAASRNNDRVSQGLVDLEGPLMKNTIKLKDGKMTERSQRTLSNKLAKERNSYMSENPYIRTSELYEGMQETDRFMSFDGRFLGEDRLLANYNHRLIVDKTNGDMYMLTFDEMRQGSGSGTMDAILNAGTPEGISVDITKINRLKDGVLKADPSAARVQRGITSQADASSAIREGMEQMMGYESTLVDRAKTAAKAGGVLTGAGNVYGYANEED